MYDVSGLHPLQQSVVIGSYVKMLVRVVPSDRYRLTQEKSLANRLVYMDKFVVFKISQFYKSLTSRTDLPVVCLWSICKVPF